SFDAFTTLTQIATATERIKLGTNIANIYARTPAMLAGTAASLDQLSGGRFILGIGVSGPQVIEGWHGVPYDRPIRRTRETIDIVRKVLAGDKLVYDGEIFSLTQGLRLLNKPLRPDMPIYVASLGPRNVELTAELADGWLPAFFHPDKAKDVWGDSLAKGTAKRSADLGPLEISAGGMVAIGEDVKGLLDFARPMYALYVGGMGARGKNFYNDLFARYGYEAEAKKIQDLYLDGLKRDAAAAVPDAFVDEVALVGPKERLAERLDAWRESGATSLLVSTQQVEALQTLAEIAL
ncbi:MAG TPA: LLM class F420-dependent oxidoreductase, partial [Gaiellaceae bacterium]|nr:LLM class F420-dependent oxidoreductase [Gaiellaceae bacterium]